MPTAPLNLPAEPGLYFAKTATSATWNLMAYVFGTAPFLQVEVWNFLRGRTFTAPTQELGDWMTPDESRAWGIAEFGPMLTIPDSAWLARMKQEFGEKLEA